MAKQWLLSPTLPPEYVEQFPEQNRLVLQLLYNRGVSANNVEHFLQPEYSGLYSPFLFQEMELAANRVWEAIEKKEKIYIYGDYDADAVTANAVLQQTFRYLGVKAFSYIPDRFSEGYGLNVEAFKKLKEQGAQLVITVDCGTNSVAEAEFCRANGIDLIITDHHEIVGSKPEAFALVNPKNPADLYPDDQITGVGVAYKLAAALLSNQTKVCEAKGILESEYVPEWDKWLLDLVAIGTVADIHSLLGENRILVRFGLKVLPKTKWPGLRQLMENAGIDRARDVIDTRTLGFVVAPRINAAGRLEHADIALNLLIAEDFGEAIELSNQLEDINRRRKDMTARIVSEAKSEAELILDRRVLLLANANWPKGLVGIVAGKLVDQYKRPVLVLEKGELESTGSARSFGDFNIVECLKINEHLLVKYGGHKQAAGLTVASENLEVLYQEILRFADSQPAEENKADILQLEAELLPGDLRMEMAEDIARLEPFGEGNPVPSFMLKNVELINFRLVGAKQQHLQLQVRAGDVPLECIGFNFGYIAPKLTGGVKLDLAGELITDSWQGMKKLKLKLLDIKVIEHVQNIGD
jgi:single-stranded-DNA-specific exonuclease